MYKRKEYDRERQEKIVLLFVCLFFVLSNTIQSRIVPSVNKMCAKGILSLHTNLLTS